MVEHSGSANSRLPNKNHSLINFKTRGTRILVTSDALTRGMDIPGVDLVVNYDAPTYPKTYVHRAGRTARAGNEGMLYIVPSAATIKPLLCKTAACSSSISDC